METNQQRPDYRGVIKMSRSSSNTPMPLYGAQFPVSEMIELDICESSYEHNSQGSYYKEGLSIATVTLSKSQMAELLLSGNGQKVPCTISHIKGVGCIKPQIGDDDLRANLEKAAVNADDECKDRINTAISILHSACEDSKSISKTAIKQALNYLASARDNYDRDRVHFSESAIKQIEEAFEKGRLDLKNN